MNLKTEHLIRLIESWEKSYLPTSAQIVMKECKELIINQDAEIEELKAQLASAVPVEAEPEDDEPKEKPEEPVTDSAEAPKPVAKKKGKKDGKEEADRSHS